MVALAIVGGLVARPAPTPGAGPPATAAGTPVTVGAVVVSGTAGSPFPRPVCTPGLRCGPTGPVVSPGPAPLRWLAALAALVGLVALTRGRVARRDARAPVAGPGPPLYRPPRATPLLAVA